MTQEAINHQFLLLTHMVCADQQIHSEEAKALRQLANQAKIGEQTLNEMEKILAQEDNHLSVDYLANQVPPGNRTEAMRQLLAVAYVDGHCSPLEKEMVNYIGNYWNWRSQEIQLILEEAEGLKPNRTNKDNNESSELSFAARLLKNEQKSPLSRAVLGLASQVAPKTVGRTIQKLEREILLAGPEYDEAIEQCAKIAKEDYEFAEKALKDSYSALHTLGVNLKKTIEQIQQKTSHQGQANTAKEVAKQLETSRKSLTAEIIKELESVRESLRAKQRALNHFSIAFMGKTKAGKSTLHAIVTGEGWEAIGVGKQRTTRLNRVYEWKNVRIIDTPGIGAPGGKSDEEIARSVIDESDVICYVVTNDSVQETEFEFMRLLKEKAKPLIILLNVKYNLRDSRRLEHFLKDPNKHFAMEGNSSLKGHFDRIHRYAQEHYANDYLPIIPVMLLAAQMSREQEHQENQEKLFQVSKIQDFLDSIRESLIKDGAIRRSQTLLDSTVSDIEKQEKWVSSQFRHYRTLADTLRQKGKEIEENIKKSQQEAKEYLQKEIGATFKDASDQIQSFAEDHWNANEISMKNAWENQLKSIKFQARLQNAYEEAGNQLNKDIKESLEEIGKELQLIARLNAVGFSLQQQDSIDIKNLFRVGGTILTIGSAVAMLVVPPVGIVLVITAGIASIMSGRFKSKRREAVESIKTSLLSQLEQHQRQVQQQAESDFEKSCQEIASRISVYFEELIQGLDTITNCLETTENQLEGAKDYLNRAYAKRILDWCLEQYQPLTDTVISKTVKQVTREFGRSITISPFSEFQSKKSLDECKKVLQEDIIIKK